MIVIADASPLNYLVLIGESGLLLESYGRVVVPEGVVRELTSGATPAAVRSWMAAAPAWVEIRRVDVPPDAGLGAVDQGEAEAIVLAESLRPDVLLVIDDRDGSREATRRGIPITGTLGVLNDAAERRTDRPRGRPRSPRSDDLPSVTLAPPRVAGPRPQTAGGVADQCRPLARVAPDVGKAGRVRIPRPVSDRL